MPSRALGPASESCVFIFLHQTREHTILDYKRVVFMLLGVSLFAAVYLSPAWPDATPRDAASR